MATAYTSLLGLALPVTGELSGSWGDVVNDSITSLLDSAISGTTSITTDADVTLTTTTGAANQARQAIILWNPASGTVTRNITAPAQSKIYTVINASGGTQSIVFRGAGPTTGVTIVKGESAVVAWNGTDFIKVSNTGGSASFTNVTVSGTTTLSGLTASTALALDASKNVVSVTNTGTGNNVLATSPTLVTPALGTPSSATLTNATGLPVSTGISGLGTGVATALAVNVGTAGAPVINGGVLGTPSSGTVTNLTGTASININGTVGATTANTGAFTTLSATGVTTVQAGTAAAPAITTSGDTNTGIFFPAADTIAFAEGGAESMRIDSSGNLGIGTTSPTNRLSVTGSANVTGNVTLGDATTDTVTVNGYMGVGGAANAARGINVVSTALTGDTQMGVSSAPTFSSATVSGFALFTQPKTVAASFTATNVIGLYAVDAVKGAGSTITGQYAVYIADQTQGTSNFGIFSIVSSGANKWNLYIQGTADNYFAGNVQFAAGSAAAPALTRFGDTNTGIFFPAADTIAFAEGGSERMRIDSSGNLLVGLTSATGVALLQVSGPIRTTGYTVATLPAGTVGMRTYVTDALAPSFGVAVAGSGAVTIPVFYNGANWIVA